MPRLLPPLLVLPLLLGACATSRIAERDSPPPAPIRLADRLSPWGELPCYDAKGQYFVQLALPGPDQFPLNGSTVVDLLVDRDGTVLEGAVIESSGSHRMDLTALTMYRHARYSLPLSHDGAAPYVVRQLVTFKSLAAKVSTSVSGDLGGGYGRSPAFTETFAPGPARSRNGYIR
jgi:TonB family protein